MRIFLGRLFTRAAAWLLSTDDHTAARDPIAFSARLSGLGELAFGELAKGRRCLEPRDLVFATAGWSSAIGAVRRRLDDLLRRTGIGHHHLREIRHHRLLGIHRRRGSQTHRTSVTRYTVAEPPSPIMSWDVYVFVAVSKLIFLAISDKLCTPALVVGRSVPCRPLRRTRLISVESCAYNLTERNSSAQMANWQDLPD